MFKIVMPRPSWNPVTFWVAWWKRYGLPHWSALCTNPLPILQKRTKTAGTNRENEQTVTILLNFHLSYANTHNSPPQKGQRQQPLALAKVLQEFQVLIEPTPETQTLQSRGQAPEATTLAPWPDLKHMIIIRIYKFQLKFQFSDNKPLNSLTSNFLLPCIIVYLCIKFKAITKSFWMTIM